MPCCISDSSKEEKVYSKQGTDGPPLGKRSCWVKGTHHLGLGGEGASAWRSWGNMAHWTDSSGDSLLPDKPRFEESGCPGNQTWQEGMEQMLACVPKGNPKPVLMCTWNGTVFDLEVPQKATQNHSRTYCCTATNQLGSVSKDVAVLVEGDCGSPSARPRVEIPQGRQERAQWAGEGEADT